MKNKGMYRLLSGVLCTSVLLSSQAYAAASADYSDFPQNWSKDAMEFAVKNNFITGVSEDNTRTAGGNPLSRDENRRRRCQRAG